MAFSKALIVDDSKLARVTLKKKLESLGLDVVVAESAYQAYEAIEQNAIDIIFMDHLMPEIDGFEATQQLRKNGLQLPIIMCTGKEHDSYLEEALAIGANYILSKPPVDEDLAAVLSMRFADAEEDAADTVMTVDDFDLSELELAIEEVAQDEPIPTLEQIDEVEQEEQLFSDDMDLSWLNQQQGFDTEEEQESALISEEIVLQPVAEAASTTAAQVQGLSKEAVQSLIDEATAEKAAQLQSEIQQLEEKLDALSAPMHAVEDTETLQAQLQQQNEAQLAAFSDVEQKITALEENLRHLSEAENTATTSDIVDRQEIEMLVQSSIDASRTVIIDELDQRLRQIQQQIDEMPIATSSGDENDWLIRMEEILHPRLIEIKSNLLDDVDNRMQQNQAREMDELLELRLNVLLGERMAAMQQRIKSIEDAQSAMIPTMVNTDGATTVSQGDEQAQIERFRQSEKLTRHLDQLIEENALFAKRIQQIRQLSLGAAAAAGASLLVVLIHNLFG